MSVGGKTKIVVEVLTIIILCIISAEILCHLFPKIFYEFEYRYLYCSRNALRNIDDKHWTYTPNSLVRSVTVYKYPGSQSTMEGDITLRTNSLGFVQQTELDKDKKSIAILGDSFTEGQLCDPWFYNLEDSFLKNTPDYQLINFGLMRTGPQQWELLFNDVRKGYNITKSLIIFIQNDFEREASSWEQHQMDCIDKGICTDDYWFGIDIYSSHDEIFAVTEARELDRHGDSLATRVDGFLRKWLYSYRYIRATVKSIIDANTYMNETAYKEAVEKNIAALRAIVSELGNQNVAFLAVSTRPEAERHAFEEKTKHIIRELSSFTPSSQIHSILLEPKDFFEYDGHPNAQGYEKIKNTAASILAGMAR